MFKPSPHKKYSSIKSSEKILAKHASSGNLWLLNCCRDRCLSSSQSNQQTKEIYQPKISIKQLMKNKQPSQLKEQSQSRSKSKKTKTSNKISIQSLVRKNQKQNIQKKKPSNHQMQNSNKQPKNQTTVSYKQIVKNKETPINNFSTANYVVTQCLVQPQQTNIMFEENQQIKATIEDELNSIFSAKNQNHVNPQQDAQKNIKNKRGKKEFETNLKQQLRSYANFSFGHRQKQEIFNKYLSKTNTNMKKSSNRQSQKSKAQRIKFSQQYEIDRAKHQQSARFHNQEKNRFLRDTFQKKSLNPLVNKVGKNIFRSQSQNIESQDSMIIDPNNKYY